MRPEEKAQRLLNGETIVSKEPGNSMVPLIKSRQPCRIVPVTWLDVEKGDIVYCKVKGYYYTHLVKGINDKKGVLIGNNRGGINGWTRNVYGRVIAVLPFDYKKREKKNVQDKS